METWTYVALGDSTPAGFGVGVDNYVSFLGEYIRQDFKVQVDVLNYARSGDRTKELLDKLKSNNRLRTDIKNADIITIWTGWNDMVSPLSMYQAGFCGGEDNLDCIREAVRKINANFDAIFDEILNLNPSKNTRIIAADVGIPPTLLNSWRDNGWLELLQAEAYEAWREHLVKTTQKRGVTVLHSYQVLNGPEGNEFLEGIAQSDGFHFNQKGHVLLADLHRQAL
jgi:lysophospholipase L1-like esterase